MVEEIIKYHPASHLNNWVLIVAGGLLQVPAVKAARELGFNVLLTDRDASCACRSSVEEFVQLDTFDVKAHIDLAQAWRGKLAAVFTAGADPVVTVASAAETAGCHGLPVEIAKTCADKSVTRALLSTFDVRQPDWCKCNNLHALGEAMRTMQSSHTKVIIKALVGSGSRGHTRIVMPALSYDLTWIRSEIERAYKKASSKSSNGAVLLEELLTGVELSVETLWYNGRMYPLNAVERPFKPDSCIELGHYNPAQLSEEDYQSVWAIIQQAGNAIGMGVTTGGHILKGDLIMTDEGPKVLELTPRLSGGFDSAVTSPASRGVNYIRGALRLALGRPLSQALPDFLPRWHKHSVCLAVFSPQGKVKQVQGIDQAKELGCEVILRYNVGDSVPELVDCTQRAGFVIATCDTERAALSLAEAARDVIVYEVE